MFNDLIVSRAKIRMLRIGLVVAVSLILQACATRMPSVSEFMVPGIRSINFGGSRSYGTRDTGRGEAWRYACTGSMDSANAAKGLAECREWYEDGFRSSDSGANYEAGGSYYAGDKFRLGIALGTYSGVELIGGYRGDHLGVMGWIGLPGAGWGGAVVQRAQWKGYLDGGLYEYIAENQLGPTFHSSWYDHQDRIIGYYEAGFGSWIHIGNFFGPLVDWRAGRELSSGRWRYRLGVSFSFACLEKEWLKCGEPEKPYYY